MAPRSTRRWPPSINASRRLPSARRTFYAAVNQEYAKGDQVLHDGDEVAIFPPVSGGVDGGAQPQGASMKRFEITGAAAVAGRCGAARDAPGLWRDHDLCRRGARRDGTGAGVRGTDFLNYEAYT
jgi:hypothetical protein